MCVYDGGIIPKGWGFLDESEGVLFFSLLCFLYGSCHHMPPFGSISTDTFFGHGKLTNIGGSFLFTLAMHSMKTYIDLKSRV